MNLSVIKVEAEAIYQIVLNRQFFVIRVFWLHFENKMASASVHIGGMESACV